jgi:hypothetical protein
MNTLESQLPSDTVGSLNSSVMNTTRCLDDLMYLASEIYLYKKNLANSPSGKYI